MKKIIAIAFSAILALVISNVHAAGTTASANNIKARISTSTDVLDKKGKLLYSVKRYDESQLKREIKSLVHNQYAEFDIAGVEEIVMPGTTESIYIVHLQDDTHIKIVRIYNGETEVTGTYKRG